MNYCVEENGMNEPLSISSQQVTSNPLNDQNTPLNNINPTPTSPGLDFASPNPQINITLNQPATLTLIYLPTNRPNQPTNVNEFQLAFVFPNNTVSETFTSQTPSSSTTTTTTSTTGTSLETTTTPSTGALVPPSSGSPQVDLPPNFDVPKGTVIMIMITSTEDFEDASGVSKRLLFLFSIVFS